MNMRVQQYTSVYWLGKEREITQFQATSRSAAGEMFDEMGWNSYDDRHLFVGHLTAAQVDEYEEQTRLVNGPSDADDEAACRADHQMDQERDDRLTGDL